MWHGERVREAAMHSSSNVTAFSDAYITSLGSKIGAEWPLLGINLGYSQAQIDQLQQAYPRNASACIVHLLTKWRDAASVYEISNVQIGNLLADAFREVNRADLVEEVRRTIKYEDDVDHPQASLLFLEDELKLISFHDDIVSDTNILEAQTKRYLTQWRQKSSLYVKTRAWTTSLNTLSRDKLLTITGNPGDGKTTLACYLMTKMADTGYKILIVSNPELIEKTYDPSEQVMYFVDDAFGVPSMSQQLVEKWIRMNEKIESFIESGNFGLILATRKQVLSSSCTRLDKYCRYLENTIDLTDKDNALSENERVEMLMKHCVGHKITMSDHLMKQSKSFNMSGFPLLCKLYASDKRLQSVEDFFVSPLQVLNRQIQALSTADPKAFCGLVLILINNGKLPKSMFDVFDMSEQTRTQVSTVKEACVVDSSTSLVSIEEALDLLVGVYVSDIDEYFTFIHDAIFDAVTFVFGKRFPSKIIKICSPEFLHRRVQSEWCGKHDNRQSQGYSSADVIVVPKRLNKVLAERFVSDILGGNVDIVFDNPSIFDDQIQTHMVDRIRDLSQNEKHIFLHRRDRISNTKMIHWVCHQGLLTIAHCLFEEGMPLNASYLLTSCENGHKDMINFFVRKGLDINEQPETCGMNAIHVAALKGHTSLLKHIIDIGAIIDAKDAIGTTALGKACGRGNSECVKMLLGHGANPVAEDSFTRQPIHQAVRAGSVDCAKLLVEAGANPFATDSANYQAIHFAAECENVHLISYLLDLGADPNVENEEQRRPLHYASKFGRKDNIALLISKGANVVAKTYKGRQALHMACLISADDIHIDEILPLLVISNINDEDNEGMTALHYACKHPKDQGFSKVKLLLSFGADIHVIDKTKMQPLTYACDSNSVQTAKLLVERGADVQWKGFCGRQAIHFSAAMNNTELTTLLIEHGADLNANSSDGLKPIHYACRHGAIASVKQLLNLGVSPDERDLALHTPLFYVCLKGYVDIVRLLLTAGADPTCTDYLGRQPTEMLKLRPHDEEIRQILKDGIAH